MMLVKFLILVAVMANQCLSSSAEVGIKGIIHSSNMVSNDIYKILGKTNKNVLFCPISSNVILSLVTLAAKGKTAEELKTGLHLNIGDEEVKNGYKRLLTEIKEGKLKIATRLFPKTGVTLKQEFLKLAQRFFDSAVQSVDYSDPIKAAKIINDFVKEKTNQKIQDLVDSKNLDNATTLLTVNAAHFKDKWQHPFDNVEDSEFYHTKSEKVMTKMMDVTNIFEYKLSTALNAKVLQLPFKTKDYSMVFVLPNEIDGLNDVEARLLNFDVVLSDLERKPVDVKIPKFKIEAKLDMKQMLQEIGIKTLFGPDSDLTELVSDTRLFVSDVLQKTYIDVNENGVEAAAATDIGMVGLARTGYASTETFTADHPFIFAIMYKKYIIFQGRYSRVK